MDPITTAIVAALIAGAASGTAQVGASIIVDAYTALKNLLISKFGKQSDILGALGNIEQKPISEGRKQTLHEEVQTAKADQDPDLLKAANDLLEKIKSQPGGNTHIQTAIGNYIAQADRGSTASVRVNKTDK